jgi:transcription elongation GreA/GreB family factor
MQIPTRRAQKIPRDDGGPVYLTRDAIERIKRTIHDLEKNNRPQAVEDVSRTVALGDLSENAEYQEAKFRLRNIDGRLFSMKDRLRRAVEIDQGPSEDGRVTIGSTVTLEKEGKKITYEIVGEVETAPAKGRLSFKSPLGSALMGRRAGEAVSVASPNGTTGYLLIDVS